MNCENVLYQDLSPIVYGKAGFLFSKGKKNFFLGYVIERIPLWQSESTGISVVTVRFV